MKVLVDTCVWSLALRRRNGGGPEAKALEGLIQAGQVGMIGPIRQELLAGLSQPRHFEALRLDLEAFEDLPLQRLHFETGAEFFNACRKRGIQGSHTDFLICAVSHLQKWPVFTVDKDFKGYAKHLPFSLFDFKP